MSQDVPCKVCGLYPDDPAHGYCSKCGRSADAKEEACQALREALIYREDRIEAELFQGPPEEKED